MSERFIKPHCRDLSASISEVVVGTENLLENAKQDRPKLLPDILADMKMNYEALPKEIRSRLAFDMANLETVTDQVVKEGMVTEDRYDLFSRYGRNLQKSALSEGLAQIAACIVGD